MLAPSSRRLLVEALRPPEGFRFDSGLATTFTLDLVTLMTVPLALHLYDIEDQDVRAAFDPVALLDALRQSAGRLTVFCDTGHISVPASQERLFALLEDMVVEVSARLPGGCFHPKVWVLRYVGDAEVRYRVLCSSRNLTADRSWDTLLVLDGPLVDRKVAYAVNHPLADFVASLPSLARSATDGPTTNRVALFSEELRRVEFEVPEGFETFTFWPLGLGKKVNPFASNDRRRLIISPFVSGPALRRLTAVGKDHILITRPESLSSCPSDALSGLGAVYALAANVDAEVDPAAENALSGLHAKIVVGDRGWRSSVWVGSANATDAALHKNVEFVVELTGLKSKCGIDAVLTDLRPMLSPVDVSAVPPEEAEHELAAAQEEQVQRIVAASLSLRVGSATGSVADLELQADAAVVFDDRLVVTTWPITLPQQSYARRLAPGPGAIAAFSSIAVDSVTAFMAFEVAAGAGLAPVRFVRILPLVGVPSDRLQRILKSVLANREQVLRMLLMLLADDKTADGRDDAAVGLSDGFGRWLGSDETLLEALLRALHDSPERLDRVQDIVAELMGDDAGRNVLPAGFETIWKPVWQTRNELRND